MGSAIFSGLLGGIGEGLHERWEKQRQMREGASKAALNYLTSISQRPDFDPTMIPELNRAYFQVLRETAQPGSVLPSGKSGKGKQTGPLDLAEQLMGGMGQQISSMPSAQGRPGRTAEIAGGSGLEAQQPSPWTIPPMPPSAQAQGVPGGTSEADFQARQRIAAQPPRLPEMPEPTGAMPRAGIPAFREVMGPQRVTLPEGPSGPTTRRGYIIPPHEMAQIQFEKTQQQEALKHKNAMELAQIRAPHLDKPIRSDWQSTDPNDNKTHTYRQWQRPDGTTYIEDMGVSAAKPSSAAQRPTNVMVPGEKTYREAHRDPTSPSGYRSLTGEALPVGTVPFTPPRTMLSGENLAIYDAVKARNPNATDEQIHEMMGEVKVAMDNIRLGRTEQLGGIDTRAYSVPMGRGIQIPTIGTPPTPSPTTVPASPFRPVPQVPPPGGTTGVPPTTAAPRAGTPSRSEKQSAIRTRQLDEAAHEKSVALASLLGTFHPSNKVQQGVIDRGTEALRKDMGLSPAEFQTAAVEFKAQGKALENLIEYSTAYGRVQSVLQTHAKNFEDAATAYGPGNIPLANMTWQQLQENIGPHPELQQYYIALSAVQREYARLISGGVQSRAQLPVSSSEKGEVTFKPNATLADIYAGVKQLKIEADSEAGALKRYGTELKEQMGKFGRKDQAPQPPGFDPKDPMGLFKK